MRLAGLKPARVATLESGTRMIRSLLHDQGVEVGAARPARLPHPRPVPVWVAAAGPRTLRAAGRVADGVFIRAGRHPAVIEAAVQAVREGAREAGRHPDAVRLGLVLHTALEDDRARALLIGKSMAAGYFEYSPQLFATVGLAWDGPNIHDLQKQIFPDFHHHTDLVESGTLVDFLPTAAADAFSVRGSADDVAAQLVEVLSLGIAFDLVVTQPVPNPPPPGGQTPDFMERMAHEVLPVVRARLG
ncbi:MAG: LLM class flavin-dependent oxidoreductase [Dehalococcoidia bacterium]|nr:MAG: LLM class flavin-dependent oxidoreductase [Dehalococcoidia bacterium]